VTWILAALAVVVLGGLAWGHFEAGWVRLRTLEVPLERLPPELDGLRIVHLADFHLGVPSRGSVAVERAVAWTEARDPDLVLLSGDLLSRRSGERRLRALLARLKRCYAILGNHDLAESTRDPFSQPVVLRDLAPAHLLLDEAAIVELRGKRIQIVGVDPRTYLAGTSEPAERIDPDADLRILLCHYPYILDTLPPGAFDLVLAGHLHDGQICIPYPGGKVRLAHMNWHYTKGLYRKAGGVMHLSSGLGTTFVPFRFCARPEATELVLRGLHSG
jgi:predicted MPP superfamily phosphohydrolase